MRYNKVVLMVGAAISMVACGGGDKPKADDKAAGGAAPAAGAATTPAPAAGGAAVAYAAPTGTTHEVKMTVEGTSYKFVPAELTIKEGDAVKFINASGGPHNVSFDPAAVPADVKAQLSANMPNQNGELSGPTLVAPNEAYTVSFAKIKAGKYEVHCTPHMAMNMKMALTVQ
jgi:plastocyanin